MEHVKGQLSPRTIRRVLPGLPAAGRLKLPFRPQHHEQRLEREQRPEPRPGMPACTFEHGNASCQMCVSAVTRGRYPW